MVVCTKDVGATIDREGEGGERMGGHNALLK